MKADNGLTYGGNGYGVSDGRKTLSLKADNGLTYSISGFAVVNGKGEVVTKENEMSKHTDVSRFEPMTFRQKWVAQKVAEGMNEQSEIEKLAKIEETKYQVWLRCA